jgi:hypothetical protein
MVWAGSQQAGGSEIKKDGDLQDGLCIVYDI